MNTPSEPAGIVFRNGGYYLERGGTWRPEPLIPGREYPVGTSRIMISRIFLHGRWKARLEILSRDKRRRFPLSRILDVPQANCILGDDEAAESANLYYRLEDDDNSPERMSLISDQHLEIRATGPRGLTVTNLSTSKPVWLLAGNSEEIERELAPGRSEGGRRAPGESSELMRAQRIVLGIHELRYLGPGRTGSVELSAELDSSKGPKVRNPWN